MEPNTLTIPEAHKGLTSKTFSCVDLVQACLKQIEKYDDKIKAFITLCESEALEKAKLVDEKIGRGEEIGILEGIPFSVDKIEFIALNDSVNSSFILRPSTSTITSAV